MYETKLSVALQAREIELVSYSLAQGSSIVTSRKAVFNLCASCALASRVSAFAGGCCVLCGFGMGVGAGAATARLENRTENMRHRTRDGDQNPYIVRGSLVNENLCFKTRSIKRPRENRRRVV